MGSDPAILIVGAGPVGLEAALELARRGFRPRVVDRGPGPTPERESRALGRFQATLTAAVLPFVMMIPQVRRLVLRNILAREMPPPP